MPIKPSVYCSAPHWPRFYSCASKNKSPVRLSWPQKSSEVEEADPSGDGEPPPGPELGPATCSGLLCVESEPHA